jgi:hypothetical protein
MAEIQTNDNVHHSGAPKPYSTALEDKQTSLNTSKNVPTESSTRQTIIRERDPRTAVFADKLVISLALILLRLCPKRLLTSRLSVQKHFPSENSR